MAHAKLSPSSAVRWMTCPGSVALSEGIPQRRSQPAAYGTVGHALAERALKGHGLPVHDLGRVWYVGDDGEVSATGATPGVPSLEVTVDQELVDIVDAYVASVREYMVGAEETFFEVKVPIGHLTGEEGATGTADAAILRRRELQVHDLKTGHHEVEAVGNKQLKLYALGVLCHYGLLFDFDTVLCVIHQPKHGGPKEARYTVEELDEFAAEVKAAANNVREAAEMRDVSIAQTTWERSYLTASPDGCKFCPARATCPELLRTVDEAVAADFDTLDADTLGSSMAKVEMVESWCKEVRAEVERRLLAGTPVAGYKLVQGRRGTRKWTSADIAEEVLVKVAGEAAYEKSLISPTTAEKLLKKKAGWEKLAELITQSEGKPSVAPESDKRDAITAGATADDFDVVQ